MDRIFAEGLFKDEVVLVTGGGTGIGQVLALELGGLGAKVAICGRRKEPLERTAALLGERGIPVFHATCDVRKPEEVAALVDGIVERFGRIDVLINNAGGQFPMPAQMLVPKGFEAVVRNNLLGTWIMTHTVANRCFIPQKRGRIVSIIAQIARGFPGMAHTGAARAGVENLMKTLAVEWSQFGIRANSVAPGIIRTSGTEQYPPELLENGKKGNPLKRLGTAEEVSHLVTYLASRYADFITGQTFYIDGGASIWGDMWALPSEVPQYPPYPVPE
jgi:citronellol/citronellal dehydrogenase